VCFYVVHNQLKIILIVPSFFHCSNMLAQSGYPTIIKISGYLNQFRIVLLTGYVAVTLFIPPIPGFPLQDHVFPHLDGLLWMPSSSRCRCSFFMTLSTADLQLDLMIISNLIPIELDPTHIHFCVNPLIHNTFYFL